VRRAAGREAESGVNALIGGENGVSVSRRYHVGIASVRNRPSDGLRPRAMRRARAFAGASGRAGFTHPTGRGSGAAGCRRYVDILPSPPCGGRARQDLGPSVLRIALSPARGTTGTPLAAGRGVGWEGPDEATRKASCEAGKTETQGVGGISASCRASPTGSGLGRIWVRRSCGEPHRLRLRFGDRPARGAAGTPQGAGRGAGGEGVPEVTACGFHSPQADPRAASARRSAMSSPSART
jgi:hypothetical protein